MTVVATPPPAAGDPAVQQPPIVPNPAPNPVPATSPRTAMDKETYRTRRAEIEAQAGMSDFLAAYHEYEIKPEVRTIHDKYDQQVEKLLGVKRKAGEATYDMISRVFAEGLVIPRFKHDQLLEAAKAAGQTIPDPATPPPAVPATPGSAPTLVEQQITALTNKITDLENDKTKAVNEAREGYHKQAVQLVLGSQEVFVPDFVPEADRQAYADDKRAELAERFMKQYTTNVDNNLTVYYKGDAAQLNDAGQPLTLPELISRSFKYDLKPAATPPPAGMGGQSTGAATHTSTFKTLGAVVEYVHNDLKLIPESTQAREKIKELKKQNNL